MMNNEEIFAELQGILKNLGIELKYGRGYFEGGLCRYNEGHYIYLNRAQKIEDHISVILTELKKIDLDNIECSAFVKNLLTETETNEEG